VLLRCEISLTHDRSGATRLTWVLEAEGGRPMDVAPWYLFSLGIALVLLGAISGAFFGAGASSRAGIDPRMSDAEVARRLKRRTSPTLSGLVVALGLLCLLVSVVWRVLRFFL
jgi:hypothetical protein